MRRFHVFNGISYFPTAGTQDYKGSFGDLNSAIAYATKMSNPEYDKKEEWSCVIESDDENRFIHHHIHGYPYFGFTDFALTFLIAERRSQGDDKNSCISQVS